MKKKYDLTSFFGALFISISLISVNMILSVILMAIGMDIDNDTDFFIAMNTLISGFLVITGIVLLNKLSWSKLFHDSPNSVKATMALLSVPVMLVVAGTIVWIQFLSQFLFYDLVPGEPDLAFNAKQMRDGLVLWWRCVSLHPWKKLFSGGSS
ncbi:hypothetical protein [Photobacterium sp. 1_MG-2023]|uniref:hypothetical protein n=1 Tax=Photobacterium sp. 1_MG-2023 TaxID=3062646 RepID=UPI0026E2DEA3|nr:hypothetical protein [Photobacterium sp. 1_MG-2023]MDO6705536.1 hypothetical protein [Photobacterium sp. 1_MG-2023]